MVWIGCIRCKKLRHNFVARTYVLIASIRLVLHQVLCSNETVPDAPKHYETHRNMSLGSNGVDREHSLRKILARHSGMNFCISCTSFARFAASFCAVAKRFQMHPNGIKRTKA